MSKEDLAPFGGVVLAFMFVCALIGGAAFLVVGGSSVQFFVGGRTLNVFVVTATLASQARVRVGVGVRVGVRVRVRVSRRRHRDARLAG